MKACRDWSSVILGTTSGNVSIRDVRDLRGDLSISCFKNGHVSSVCKLDSSSDLLAVSADGRVGIWDRRLVSSPILFLSSSKIYESEAIPSKRRRIIQPHFEATLVQEVSCGLRSVQWLESYDNLLASGSQKSVRLHCPRSGLLVAALDVQYGTSCALVPKMRGLFQTLGCPVAVGDLHGRVSIYDIRGSQLLWREEPIRGHIGAVSAVAGFGSAQLVSVGSDGMACVREFRIAR